MKRTVYRCERCAGSESPCVLVAINAEMEPDRCPFDAIFDADGKNWKKVSECEIPEDEQNEQKENENAERGNPVQND